MLKTKALVLFSGGLDSMLAALTLAEQGIHVELVCFVSNFYNADNAILISNKINLPLHILNVHNELLPIVKNPPSGHGKNMNPCIDCHAMMTRIANEKLGKDFDFIATGEVLGQRPFSQNREALARVMKSAGVEILRPLSAKLLDGTNYEKNGLVNRNALYDISGRSRDRQLELAKHFKIAEFISPGGGCLLTDPGFSERLKQMIKYWPDCTPSDIEFLKHGRVYWFNKQNGEKVLVVVGRHAKDNENLEKISMTGDLTLNLKDIFGPTTLVHGKSTIKPKFKEVEIDLTTDIDIKNISKNVDSEQKLLEIAAKLTAWHSTKAHAKINIVTINQIN